MNLDPDMAMAYTDFVEERHRIWQARQQGRPQPWTDDPILASKKFTNVFRILDHDSQWLMKNLLNPDASPRDTLMRCFLFRHTGQVAAWEFLELMLGYWPNVSSLDEVLQIFQTYRGVEKIRDRGPNPSRNAPGSMARSFQRPLFTSAYLVFPQTHVKGSDKATSIIDLTRRLFDPASPTDIVGDFLNARTQSERFNVLRRNKGVADFMSMQILTDWGYSSHCGADRENDFIILGPGARKGAEALLGGNPGKLEDVFCWAYHTVQKLPDLPRLGDRAPSYMDVQNTLCEFSKYVRFASKPVPTTVYKPAHPGPQEPPVLPEHW